MAVISGASGLQPGPDRMPALRLSGIAKRYGQTVALDGVSLTIDRGSSHAVLGENGAGKSTLVKILSGVVIPDEGSVRVFGDEVDLSDPRAAVRHGVATAFQELSLLPDLTVAENLFLSSEPRAVGGLVLRRTLRHCAEAHLASLGIHSISPDWLASDLSLSEKQLIEIAKAVGKEPKILVLDEPTSALGQDALEWFFGLIRRLRDRAVTIVFITHRLSETREICDRVTVLRNGSVVGTHELGDISEAEVITLMIGRPLAAAFPPRRPALERPTALETEGLSRRNEFDDVDLVLRQGEILGVAGLDGQGQRELFLTLFGVLRPSGGRILVNGRAVRIRSPRDAVRAGIGISLVPEERKTEGLFLRLPIEMNLAIPALRQLSSLGWIRGPLVRREAKRVATLVNLDSSRLGAEVSSLSGGNQQKVVLAKWILAGARIMLLYDPTRGVDVGTKLEIYNLMHELAEQGVSILLYSSELPEITNIADRVIVFYGSRIVEEADAHGLTEEKLMAAAIGHIGSDE